MERNRHYIIFAKINYEDDYFPLNIENLSYDKMVKSIDDASFFNTEREARKALKRVKEFLPNCQFYIKKC